MKDRRRLGQPIDMPLLACAGDNSVMRDIKQLVDRMIRPVPAQRCTALDAYNEIRRIRGGLKYIGY